jgi:hypothetical protein
MRSRVLSENQRSSQVPISSFSRPRISRSTPSRRYPLVIAMEAVVLVRELLEAGAAEVLEPVRVRELIGQPDGDGVVVGEVAAEQSDLGERGGRDGARSSSATDHGSGTPTLTSLRPSWTPRVSGHDSPR